MIKRTYLTNRLKAGLTLTKKDLKYYYINNSSYEEAYQVFVERGKTSAMKMSLKKGN